MVNRVTRHDRGMYQCVVRNDRESAQGSAELRLGGELLHADYFYRVIPHAAYGSNFSC